jgi:hypothetical protein
MRKLLAPIALTFAAFIAPVHADQNTPKTSPAPAQTHTAPATIYTPQALELRVAMRTLWEDHITYTRNFIISALAKLPDQKAVTERLLKNQDDIGNAIKPYYGEEAGKKLTALLRDHIVIAGDVVKAAAGKNSKLLAQQQARWTANGKEIAAFLAAANTNWSKKDLEQMLQMHLDLTSGEVVGRLTKNWAKDIESYDEGHKHMLMFADMLTDGIVKQFPDKFTSKREVSQR